jgi:hypothetical protein
MARQKKPVSVAIGTQPFTCTGCGYLHMFYNDDLHMWESQE